MSTAGGTDSRLATVHIWNCNDSCNGIVFVEEKKTLWKGVSKNSSYTIAIEQLIYLNKYFFSIYMEIKN